MYLRKVEIQRFRNFNGTVIEFQDGVNIIIGPNNAGKSNLLKVIRLLDNISETDGSIHDFNKNDLLENLEKYKTEPPCIEITYHIEHTLSMDSFDDGILRIKDFIVYNSDGNVISSEGNYTINAKVLLKYELDKKYINDFVDEMRNRDNLEGFLIALKKMIPRFSWNYYNTTSNLSIKKSDVYNIFNIDYIPADRNTEGLLPHTKKYIKNRLADIKGNNIDLKDNISKMIGDNFNEVTEGMKQLFEIDQDKIGINNGNNSLIPSFLYDSSFEQYFQYIFKDSNFGYELPMDNNGLGYNNLVQIYNIIKFKINNDFNILLIEEPEAHLHPAMQYKLFKYLSDLKSSDKISKKGKSDQIEDKDNEKERLIRNQIFVTTHSSNITASANIDDMISLRYYRDLIKNEHKVVSDNLKSKFSNYPDSKSHLSKFLDVTRSDMMFAYKVILVEGLAEKLLMTAFANKCGIDYSLEDNHISVVEVGGITFNHFLPLFFETRNKVLCFRDCDYKYFDEELKDLTEYKKYLEDKVLVDDTFKNCDNILVKTQMNMGSTFENELFIDNFNNSRTTKQLFELVAPDNLIAFLNVYGFSINSWYENLVDISDGNTRKKIKKVIEPYFKKYNNTHVEALKKNIEKLFFANLFLNYANNKKGNLALNILTKNIAGNSKFPRYIIDDLEVPQYIKEGLEWLKK